MYLELTMFIFSLCSIDEGHFVDSGHQQSSNQTLLLPLVEVVVMLAVVKVEEVARKEGCLGEEDMEQHEAEEAAHQVEWVEVEEGHQDLEETLKKVQLQ